MNITYTGTPEFTTAQQRKLDARFSKLSKLLDRNGDKGIHVILTTQRHLQRAEITVNYYDRPMVSLESNSDALLAITGAADKLEKQILKQRDRWRDTKRTPEAKMLNSAPAVKQSAAAEKAKPAAKPAREKAAAKPAGGRVYKVNSRDSRKPMTLDEAMLEMEGGSDYTVYRDAGTDKLNVLVRRKDGHFDLIES